MYQTISKKILTKIREEQQRRTIVLDVRPTCVLYAIRCERMYDLSEKNGIVRTLCFIDRNCCSPKGRGTLIVKNWQLEDITLTITSGCTCKTRRQLFSVSVPALNRLDALVTLCEKPSE